VLAALDRVVASAAFGKAERPARFLRHLVETALRGEPHLLKESVLGADVFERPADWDPRLDPVVRQEAGRLRKRLANYYETGAAASGLRIELPVGSYVPEFRRMTGGAKAAVVEPRPAGPAPVRGLRVWPYAAAGILCLAAAVIAWRAVSRHESPASIAVLPFANLTADPANQYFSDGLTDEITDSLSRFKILRVIATSSSMQFKGKPIREVGRLLNVTNVLEGSVERSGDRIRVIARLDRVADGSLLWSNTYERGTSDLFAVQSELAAGIAASLKATTGGAAAPHVPNAEAYDAVLKARSEMEQLSTESLKRAQADYQHAVDVDPEYAAGYLGLAIVEYDRFTARGATFRTEAERKTAERLCRKALELDPDLPTAHAVLGILAIQYEWDWGAAEREFQTAMAGPPNSNAEGQYSFSLIFRGRFAEADQHIRRMLDLDPFSAATLNNLALCRYYEGRFAESREIAERLVRQSPELITPPLIIGMTYIREGHPELALSEFRQVTQRFPQSQIFEAIAYAAAGNREEARRLARPYEDKYPNAGIPLQWIAMAYAALDDEPNTVKWLNRAADRHEFLVLNLAVDPGYAKMRNSAGFVALTKRMGLDR
jgi:TolB-like protein/Flp pilus assembly protein TadD